MSLKLIVDSVKSLTEEEKYLIRSEDCVANKPARYFCFYRGGGGRVPLTDYDEYLKTLQEKSKAIKEGVPLVNLKNENIFDTLIIEATSIEDACNILLKFFPCSDWYFGDESAEEILYELSHGYDSYPVLYNISNVIESLGEYWDSKTDKWITEGEKFLEKIILKKIGIIYLEEKKVYPFPIEEHTLREVNNAPELHILAC